MVKKGRKKRNTWILALCNKREERAKVGTMNSGWRLSQTKKREKK